MSQINGSQTNGAALAKIKDVGTNMGWGMFGSLSYALGRFAIFVLLTKYLTAEQVGQFALALAIVTPLSFLINLELRVAYVTDTQNQINIDQCLSFRLLSNALFLLVVFLGGGLLVGHWGWQKISIVWLVALVRVMESIGDIYLGVLQKKEWIKQIGLSQMFKSLGVLVWAWLGLTFVADLRWFLIGWFVVVALLVWFYDRSWALKITPVRWSFSFPLAKKLLLLAWPLGLLITITSFHETVARLYLEHFHSDAMVAYYAAMTMIVTGLASLQNGINQALLARLARYAGQSLSKFWKLLGSLLLLTWLAMFVLTGIVWFRGEWILSLLYQADYARHGDVFIIVMLAGLLLLTAMITGDALLACRHFRSRLIAVTLGLLVNIAGCWLTIPNYGLTGAAWSALAASATVTLICSLVLVRTKNKP